MVAWLNILHQELITNDATYCEESSRERFAQDHQIRTHVVMVVRH